MLPASMISSSIALRVFNPFTTRVTMSKIHTIIASHILQQCVFLTEHVLWQTCMRQVSINGES
jgi:hypothetical protein